jgi:hypothetical protein
MWIAPASAQPTESRIVGKVTDHSNAALPGVTVNATSKETTTMRSITTDASGNYAISNLAPGAYTIQVELSGFQTQDKRDDALDAASKYDGQKQELMLDQFGGSIGGPLVPGRTFFFVSDEARRRILAGEPIGSGAGQSAERTQAVAALLGGFPQSSNVTSNPLLALATNRTQATQDEKSAASGWITISTIHTRSSDGTFSARATSIRPTGPRRRGASRRLRSRRISCSTSRACWGAASTRCDSASTDRRRARPPSVLPATTRPACRCPER